MEFQQWRNFVPQQPFPPPTEEDKVIIRSLLKLLADQKSRQEYNMSKETWYEFCSDLVGHQFDESAVHFLTRFPQVFTFTDLINDGEVLIKSNLTLALCKDHLSKEGCHNSYCRDLHCCKFYLHDTCKFRDNCSFGHDLKSGRNKMILERCMLSLNWPEIDGMTSVAYKKPEISMAELVQLLRQENPRVCKFYNSEAGCKHGSDGRKCPALHLCRQYVKHGQCVDAFCNLCHDVRSQQPFSLLTRYGHDVSKANEPAILKQLQSSAACDDPQTPASGGLSTPIKRGSPQAEQLQQDHYHHLHQQQQQQLHGNPYRTSSGYPGAMEMHDDVYSRGYYCGGALDFYESDDAAWSSQESNRYCPDYRHLGYYTTEYASDCEVPSSYAPLEPGQNQFQQLISYQVPSSKQQQQQQQMQQQLQMQQQQQTQQQTKSKEGELKVCLFYNYKGCRYGDGDPPSSEDLRPKSGSGSGEKGIGAPPTPNAMPGCQNLHLCGHFVNGACVYGSEASKCRRSHDLRTDHTRAILERHDIDVAAGDDKAILTAIRHRISQQVVEMDDGTPSSSSSMERLSLDDLDPIEMKEMPQRIWRPAKEEIISRDPCKINTFVFLDLEATGLDQPRITELSLVCVYRVDLEESEGFFNDPANACISRHDYQPRVVNKLTLCVHPRKHIEPNVSSMTGLTNASLMHQKDFDHGLVNLLSEFLDRLPRPICLVAHNGLRFDFPLLQAELVSIGRHGALPPDLLCLDSLVMFRSLDESLRNAKASSMAEQQLSSSLLHQQQQQQRQEQGTANATREQRTDWWGLSDDEGELAPTANHDAEKTPIVVTEGGNPSALMSEVTTSPQVAEDFKKKSYKLSEVHLRVAGRYPEETHRAEDDALALIRCFIFTRGSLAWADENAIQLSGVTPLVLPKRKPFEAGVFPSLSQ